MKRVFFLLPITWVALFIGQPVGASPVIVGQGAFTSPTIIDFDAIGNEVGITSQFSGSGVVFSGGIFGLTNFGDTSQFPGSEPAIASDWRYSQGNHGALPITATFGSAETLVGFWDEVNAGDTTVITTFLGGVPHGSVSLVSTGLSAVFFGVSDPSGFDSVTIDVTGSSNHFLGLDDFQFQGSASSSVPEPSAAILVIAGFLTLGFVKVKR
jgi:hypothetical protein